MPFSGPSSYLETIDQFIGHWTDVNAALNPDLTVPPSYTLANLQTDRAALATLITNLEAAINVLEGHRTDRDNQKTAIRERMRQLAAAVKGLMPDSVYVGQVPNLVPYTSSSGHWIINMDDFAHIWTTINATPPAGFTPPLLLNGAYPVATFATDVAALKATFTALTQAQQDVDRAVEEREELYVEIRERLVRYRAAVAAMFLETDPLYLSLPRLTPLPGHTPDPVVLSGVWNGTTLKADLSWTASADPDLESYVVRRSGATPYNTNTELVVATLPPETLTHSTDAGLQAEGASMGFKVYVKLTTGNERGSNAVTVTHA
jgi:hypothetical protein